MTIKYYIQTMLSMLLLLMLSACSKESAVQNASGGSLNIIPGKQVKASFKLVVKPPVQAEGNEQNSGEPVSRASKASYADEAMEVSMLPAPPATRGYGELSEEDEKNLLNGWVLQFSGTGADAKLVSKQYMVEIGDNIINPTLAGGAGEQTVYVLVNTNNASLFNSKVLGSYTLKEFEAEPSRAYLESKELTTSGSALPMSAKFVGVPGKQTETLQLTRMVAKIDFSYTLSLPEGHSFVPRAIQLQDVPKTILYPEKTGITYPSGDIINYVDYDQTDLKPGQVITWYMPENLKGENANVTQPYQKGGSSAPAGSTNIMLIGEYTRPGKNKVPEKLMVVYKIYPGVNATSSFDIIRNHYHVIKANLKNAKLNDKRVLMPKLALALFATHNLDSVNKFATTDPARPNGSLWQFGRNIPFKRANYGGAKYVAGSFRATDTRIWDGTLWFNQGDWLTPTLATDTWSSVVTQSLGFAPNAYLGENLDFNGDKSGDPCPPGYHVPSPEEFLGLTWGSGSASPTLEKITVKNVPADYTATYSYDNTYSVRYGLKFMESNSNSQITAYRWEIAADLVTVTSRYLGDAGRKYKLGDIANAAFWQKNKSADIVRYLPTIGTVNGSSTYDGTINSYHSSASKKPTNLISTAGVGTNVALPLRCVAN